MPKQSIAYTDFTEGVYSPFLEGRINLEGYYSSTKTQDNFLSDPSGVLQKRKGLRYVGEADQANFDSRLIPFQFSKTESLLLEFANKKINVWEKGSKIHTITTIFEQGELFEFQYVQRHDLIFIVHPKHPPQELKRTGNTSWSIGALSYKNDNLFNSTDNYPSCITFHEQRLVFSGTTNNPDTIYFSQTDDKYNFTVVEAGSSNASDQDPFQIKIYSDQLNTVNNLSSDQVLYVGTTGGVYRVKSSSNNAALSYKDHDIKKHTTYGVDAKQSVSAGDTIFFLQMYKRKLRSIKFDLESDKYMSQNIIIKAQNLTDNATIEQIAVTDDPHSMIICVLSNGQALTFHYEPSEKIAAWAKITTNGEIKSIAKINTESHEEVYFIVKREVDGVDKRYIEKMVLNNNESDIDSFYVDSGISINGTQQTIATLNTQNNTIQTSSGLFLADDHIGSIISNGLGEAEIKTVTSSKLATVEITKTFGDNTTYTFDSGKWYIKRNKIVGLSHLKGLTVNILGDSATFPPQKVEHDTIKLTDKSFCKNIHVGLPYDANIQLPRPEAGSAIGTSQGKLKRINEMTIRLYKSMSLRVGISSKEEAPQNEDLSEQIFRLNNDKVGVAPDLFTGDKKIIYRGNYDKESRIWIRHDFPTPCYLIAVFMDITTND